MREVEKGSNSSPEGAELGGLHSLTTGLICPDGLGLLACIGEPTNQVGLMTGRKLSGQKHGIVPSRPREELT